MNFAIGESCEAEIEAPAFNGTLMDFPAGGMFGKWSLKSPWASQKEPSWTVGHIYYIILVILYSDSI